jgi:hypothetical protein
MSRNTVERLLRLHEPPRFRGRSKLTSYEEEALRTFARLLVGEAFAMLNSQERAAKN